MNNNKSLDDSYNIIAAFLHDVSDAHGEVLNTRNARLTTKVVRTALLAVGMDFLTVVLPHLGKTLDRALVEGRLTRSSYCCVNLGSGRNFGLQSLRGTELPRFLGEFFKRIFGPDGVILQQPCVTSVKVLRQILYLFYKYELPYTEAKELKVLSQFEETEKELSARSKLFFKILEKEVTATKGTRRRKSITKSDAIIRPELVVREARILLSRLFASFDPLNIHPKHGPGAVATKQRLQSKYQWTNVAAKITKVYPLDAFFFASLGHVCDRYDTFEGIGEESLPARVCLVPKDSRGPRLISCEPVDYQWVQQGLGKAIVELVESHPLTEGIVNFTSQEHNRNVALLASRDGRYSTLDLKEASDRVNLDLVRLLFPEHVYTALEACRSASTELPSGQILTLQKYAPMGSALCFPVLALTIWAILTAGAPNTYVREHILVYGDDVIVPTAHAADAIEQLELFGFLVNHSKSCTSGFFRESCGMDAFQGVDVTPVRLRTVWSESPSPEVYTSWIAYANSFWDRRYYRVYELIVKRLQAIYGPIPSEDMHLACPSLRWLPEDEKPRVKRWNKHYQKCEFRVLDVRHPSVSKPMDGWSMLLRFFAEAGTDVPGHRADEHIHALPPSYEGKRAFSVRLYTERGRSILRPCWR